MLYFDSKIMLHCIIMSTSKTYLSNRVETLYNLFVAHLYKNSSPFEKRIVIVPSPAMKSWLMLRMAQDPHLQICTGIETYYLAEGFDRLLEIYSASPRASYKPSQLDLAVKLEVYLKEIVASYHLLPFDEKTIWKELIDYLRIKPGHSLSQRAERRLISLAEKLARLFKQYGRYGAGMLAAWEEFPGQNWQAVLWKQLFSDVNLKWTYPYRQYASQLIKKKFPPLQLHLFAISYLSTLEFSLLQSLASQFVYHHYLLSPCALFWSDTCSDKERISSLKRWKKRGLDDRREKALEELLRERNPLLANYGRLGRQMLAQIEESTHLCEEHYAAPSSAQHYTEYAELYFDTIGLIDNANALPLTMLQALQTDMLLMRTPHKGAFLNLNRCNSIRLHIAPTKQREIEILYNNLLNLIDAHASEEIPLTPSNIVVLAPDIADYRPYIQAIFGSRESQLDYQLMDLKAPVRYRLVQAFLYLLKLPLSKWDAKEVLELFESPCFHKKQGLCADDIHLLRTWVRQARIHWGSDAEHRDEILSNNHCLRGMVDKSNSGTWESGLSELMRSMAYCDQEGSNPLFSRPVDVGIMQAETLGKIIQLIRSLRSDLQPLVDGTTLTLEEWSDYLASLLDSYFCEEEEGSEEGLLLRQKIHQIGSSGKWVRGARFAFATVKKHLFAELEEEHTTFRENHLEAVKFCSMLPMRAIPSRVVAIIGMEEGSFPTQDQDFSLDQLKKHAACDYSPSQTDYDRYLFLEILLSARDHLLLSHASLTLAEDQECPPSLILTELMNYLDLAYRVNDAPPSTQYTTRHPFRNFAAAYFSDQLVNYSTANYLAAKSFYTLQKSPPHQFINNFISDRSFEISEEPHLHVDINELSQSMRNPLKLYFNKTLGIYIKNSAHREVQVEEPFTLSALDGSIIKKAALQHSPTEIMAQAQKEGIFPGGLFKNVAEKKSTGDIEQIHSIREALGVAAHEIVSLLFSEECKEPCRDDEKCWKLPPLVVQHGGQIVSITGTISNVSPKGLFGYAEDTPEDIMKYWVEFVLLGCAILRYNLPIAWSLIPLKTKKCIEKKGDPFQPEALLDPILNLYKASLAAPSPLLPEWTSAILNGKEELLEETMQKSLHDAFQPIYNDYLAWSIQSKSLPCSKIVIAEWQELAVRNLSQMYAAWFPKSLSNTTLNH